MRTYFSICMALATAFFFAGLIATLSGCGEARPFLTGDPLGDAVVGDGGRSDGSDLGTIFTVRQIVTAVGGGSIPGYQLADHPFNTPALDFNDATPNTHVPFSFTFNYPSNNFKIAQSRLVIDTQRDGSDTEGIFVDGVMTGTPPTSMVNTASPHLTDSHYTNNPGSNPVNSFYMDYSLEHYKQNTVNTFDLDLSQLLLPTTKTVFDILQDGFLPVITGDDSPIFQAHLVIEGYTISKTDLSCSTTSPFDFQNVYLHNDGNSIGQPAFNGTVEDPFTSVGSSTTPFKSIEYFVDAALPSVTTTDITLDNAKINLTIHRSGPDLAIVVNGIGVSSSGFDQNLGTEVVEQWNDSTTATNYWNTLLSSVPQDETPTAIEIDLKEMHGASSIRDLIAQGKLNISIAGDVQTIEASAATSSRAAGNPVAGPELVLDGSYVMEVCEVPSNPDSPLEDGVPPPTSPDDEEAPLMVSVQATEITSTSAVIQWLTDEGADTQVRFGAGTPDTLTTLNSTPDVFHRVELTGLIPYTYYFYNAISKDGNGNTTEFNTKVFRTLR